MRVLLVLLTTLMSLLTIASARSRHHHYTINDVKLERALIRKYYREISRFDREQWALALKLYNACYKYDLGYTCVAIGWKESRLGRYVINEKTHDYGITGININYYFKDHHLRSSYWLKERIKTKLVRNDNFAINETIWKLRYWRKKFGYNYRKIWGAYNGGSPRLNYGYSKKILNFIYAFRHFIRRNKINMLFGKG